MIQWQQSKEIKQWRRSLFEEEVSGQKKESDEEEGLMKGGGKRMKKAKIEKKGEGSDERKARSGQS